MSGPSEAQHHTHSVGFNVAAIAVLIVLAGLGVAYVLDATVRTLREPPQGGAADPVVAISLGGNELEIPRSWFRGGEPPRGNVAKQIELRVTLALSEVGTPVDVTLLPRSRVRPSAVLLDGVYLHQFGDEQLSGAPGLVGKPLNPVDGYAGETVWYDPLSADPFVAKCSTLEATDAVAQCLRTVHLGPGMAAIYAFPEAALSNWRDFDARMSEQLRRIGAL